MHKLYDFIKTFISVLVKRTVQEVDKTGGSTTQKAAVPMVADPLDEIIIDPVTKLNIALWLWEAMGTASKSADAYMLPEANSNHMPEKTQELDKASRPVAFPPLPKESKVHAKSKGFTLPKLRFGLIKLNNQ